MATLAITENLLMGVPSSLLMYRSKLMFLEEERIIIVYDQLSISDVAHTSKVLIPK